MIVKTRISLLRKEERGMRMLLKSINPQLFKKLFTVIIITLLFITFQVPTGFEPVKGDVKEDKDGNLLIDSGSKHEINMNGGIYQMQGNITVDGSGSKLLIRNTTLKYLKGSGFRYHMEVKNSGTIEIVNSQITVDVSAGGTEENIDMIVNQGTYRMSNSSLRIPGNFEANTGIIEIDGSIISQNPYGSIKSSLILNFTDCQVLIRESSVLDLKSSEHIYLHGSTKFTAINTFLNLSGSHKLRLFDTARARLYALEVQDRDDSTVISVSSSSAYAEIFRLLSISVNDETGVPVGGAKVTPRNYSNQELVPPPGDEILDYLGKKSNNYNITDYLGKVILPMRSDNITSTGADYVGNYLFDVDISTFNTDGGYSLKPYPNFYANFNNPSLSLKFTQLIPPDINGHYSKTLPALKPNSDTLYNSPLQLQQNLIIDGIILTISMTNFEMNQTQTERFYILLKNGGHLILDRSTMNDPAGWPLNVYAQGASRVSVRTSTLDLGAGILTLRSGSSLEANASKMTGSINSIGPNNELEIIESSTLKSNKIVLDKTIVTTRDAEITTGSIVTKYLEIYSVNTTFNKKLTFESNTVANLTNVTFPGVVPPHITIKDTSSVHIFWWLRIRVVDGGKNLLEKATVQLYNYTVTGQKKLYGKGLTDASGCALFSVYSEKRNASGSFKGIERNYYMNATYRSAKSDAKGTSPLTANKEIELKFDLAADLLLKSKTIIGNLFAGNILKLNATIENTGDFDLNTTQIPVRFFVDGQPLGSDVVLNQLSVDDSVEISKDWQAQKGTHIINVSVDPDNKIGEKNETNNRGTSIVTISVDGPDLAITPTDIEFDPSVPTKNSNLTIRARIKNLGGYDPSDNGDFVRVKFYLNDPDIGGTPIGTTQLIDSIPPTTSRMVETNWTVGMVGNYNIYVVVETPFDGQLQNNKANRTLIIYTQPDLYISSNDISFLPSEKLIHEAPVFIRAVVYNIGGTAVDNVGVAFYDGNPADGGSQIGFNTSIKPISPNGGTVIVQIKWTPLSVGMHQIFVKVDPNGMVSESKKSNNLANRTIEVLSKPNLYLTTTDIGFSSNTITEGDKLTIQALIHNDGKVAVSNVIVKVSLNSLSAPSIVPDIEISNIPANGIFNLQVDWLDARPNGTHNIYIWIDPNNKIPEADDLDNHASKTIIITKTLDLRIGTDDIYLNNATGLAEVGYGKTLNIKARIHNDGGSATKTQFIVQFFLNDPAGDRKLGDDIPIGTVAAGGFVDVSVDWNANVSGNQMLIVLVDPQGLVADSNLANNKAFKEFQVLTPPDLSVEEGAITFSTGEFAQAGTTVTVSAIILNIGGTGWDDVEVYFYKGDPYDIHNSSQLIGSETIGKVESLGRVPVSLAWKTDEEGIFEIFLIIDYLEKVPDPDRTNNLASDTIEVLANAPDLFISNIAHSPSYVMVGTGVIINVTLGNIGNADADQVVVDIYESYYGSTQELIDNITFPLLGPKSFSTKRYDWTGADVAGSYELYFVIDPGNRFKEFNERNNTFTYSIDVKNEPPKPDLLFDELVVNGKPTDRKIIFEPEKPKVNQNTKIRVIIRNSGDLAVGSFDVQLEIGERLIGNITVSALNAQGVEVLDFSWKPTKTGTYLVRVEIDPDSRITEISEDNNLAEESVVVTKDSESENEKISGMIGMAIAVVVIIVILIAVMFIIVIKRRKISDWAECSECGTKMPLDSMECPNCGAEFSDEMECGECHSLISVNDKSCPNCGAAFTEEMLEEQKKKGRFGKVETGSESAPAVKTDGASPASDNGGSIDNDVTEKSASSADFGGSLTGVTDMSKDDTAAVEIKETVDELDEEEFQEFERELDNEFETEDGPDSELSDHKKPLDGFDLKNGTTKPEPAESADEAASSEEKAQPENTKTNNAGNTEGDVTDETDKDDDAIKEEDKEDFIIPGAQWTAECYKCNARIPLSASICPECGAEFE